MLQTIHQATCDRCKKVEVTNGPEEIPQSWRKGPVQTNEERLLCDPCLSQLDLWLNGANIRKPRTPKAEEAS